MVRGFHVLRHSFGSNLLRAGVPRQDRGMDGTYDRRNDSALSASLSTRRLQPNCCNRLRRKPSFSHTSEVASSKIIFRGSSARLDERRAFGIRRPGQSPRATNSCYSCAIAIKLQGSGNQQVAHSTRKRRSDVTIVLPSLSAEVAICRWPSNESGPHHISTKDRVVGRDIAVSGHTSLLRTAYTAAWVRSATPSLRKTPPTYCFAVS